MKLKPLVKKIKLVILHLSEKIKIRVIFLALIDRVKHGLPIWRQKVKVVTLQIVEKIKIIFVDLREKIKPVLLPWIQKVRLILPTLGWKELVGLGVVYILIIFLFSFFVKSQVGSLSRTSKELTEEKALLVEARRLIKNREKYGREIEQLLKRIESYEAKLPERKEVSQLFRELDKIAAESQIKFVSVVGEISEEREHYRCFRWNLHLEGGYHELGRFINKLENSDRFIKVDDIQIHSNPDNFLKHNMKLEVSTFVSKS